MKTKRKIKLKVILRLLIITLIIITIIIFLPKDSNNSDSQYSKQALLNANEYGIQDILLEDQYSKTLEEVLLNNLFIYEYYDDYLEIEYLENEMFLDNSNLFLSKGYSGTEINNIYKLSITNQNKLTGLDYVDISNYVDIINYNADNTSRYNDYLNTNNIAINEAVTYVNIGLDEGFYTNTTEIDNPGNLNTNVNKFNKLPGDYIPNNLINLTSFPSYQLTSEAAEMFEKLYTDITAEGIYLSVFSAYRSYSRQAVLFNNYSNTYGVESALTFSAKAGHSEHQTGLAIDVYNPTYYSQTKIRVDDITYEWLLSNAHKYGFIVRYPKDSIDITGYVEEPWHLRYLGVDLATDVADKNITYDEYYDLYIKKY